MSDATSSPAVGADKYYRDQLELGNFVIQRCQSCASGIFYPRMICPHCGSDSLEWFAPSGKGTVYSTTVVRRKAEQGGDYNVALIDLAEGPRMMSRVDDLAPESVTIGMPVTAQVKDADSGKIVVFVKAETK
ncbi:Zn-ribbon domain-containing OB-fold protein [Candidimonas sp. SYP-B2681]|uniref:Zn-ribbon domain-containing OB-fold protein n=1 Tax=Candidimonas sp. SYP-B2681 TaxID=2497686 RepID=UPI000F86538F|nr:Zn-ribbon domain-containing OB-fold protein [Candidimonas sp. SYP-B2681]RTZ41673.1 Zn-ribbon domain-containing OB-fold protein [Candidimonas sp. SYP-B2681]